MEKKRHYLTVLSAIGLAAAASAQLYVPTEEPIPNVTSVTNEGVAVGYNDQNQPFYIWDAVKDTQTLIGGISAGQGVGGVPRFSGSGKLIAAPMYSENIKVNTEWTLNTFDFMEPFIINQTYYLGDWNLLAVGYSTDGKEGLIMMSSNNGLTWKRYDEVSRQKEDGTWETIRPDFGIYCMEQINVQQVVAGGDNGKLLVGRGNGSWSFGELTGFTTESSVKAYRAICFTDYSEDEWGYPCSDKGCMVLELEDGSFTVVYTHDGAESFSIAEGFAEKPETLGDNGEDIFLGTVDGIIQRSTDGGKTWENVFENDGRGIHRIVFADESRGVALSDNVIYITRDGGDTWTETQVLPSGGIGFPELSTWRDAVWTDDFFMIAGTNACCYKSVDDGVTFEKVSGFSGDLTAMYYDARGVCTVIGQQGNVWRKESAQEISGYTAGLYDVETDTWTPLACTGVVSDSASSPWQISGDGRHVVGIAHGLNTVCGNVVAYASIWDGTDKVTLLDNRFADIGRACRANGVSYDGSVVVGWQDIWGPWYGSVWRKGVDGSYTQQMMTVRPGVGQDDIDYEDKDACGENLTGYCQTVSDDGKWIGGRGIPGLTAVDGPWIWSEETGYNVLYHDMDGTVADVNADGTMAVGWFGPGSGAWIWTEENGFNYIQDYIDERGHGNPDLGIVSVYDISPNGRYICGYGMMKSLVGDPYPVAYVYDLLFDTKVDEIGAEQVKASVYPNPVVSELHVDLPFDGEEVATVITLYDMQGGVCRRIDDCRQSNVMNVDGLSAGIYVLDVRAADTHRTFKVIVK